MIRPVSKLFSWLPKRHRRRMIIRQLGLLGARCGQERDSDDYIETMSLTTSKVTRTRMRSLASPLLCELAEALGKLTTPQQIIGESAERKGGIVPFERTVWSALALTVCLAAAMSEAMADTALASTDAIDPDHGAEKPAIARVHDPKLSIKRGRLSVNGRVGSAREKTLMEETLRRFWMIDTIDNRLAVHVEEEP